jgi:hypothetical protein
MPMVATRLSDVQKQEIVARYRDGASSAALAASYGCSPNTVSRVVKAALDPEDYARLKQARTRSGTRSVATAEDAPPPPPVPAVAVDAADEPVGQEPASEPLEADEPDDDTAQPGVLAIDDAEDFGDDSSDELEGDIDTDDPEDGLPGAAPRGEELVQCRCLSEVELPSSAYLLVDKTVELQPTALSDCADLGPLPEEEVERRALLLYVNPRQAKRQCGRSQRVIKLPDVGVLQRTAPFLLAQGISRVVIEGSLYSLPGS